MTDRPLTAAEEAMYRSAARRLEASWDRCGRRFTNAHLVEERMYDVVMDAIPAWREVRMAARR